MYMNSNILFSTLTGSIPDGDEFKEYSLCNIANFGGFFAPIPVKLIDGTYYAHCEDAPAFTFRSDESDYCEYSYSFFCINGRVIHIEDLPIDDEAKVMLKLKYGDGSFIGCYENT